MSSYQTSRRIDQQRLFFIYAMNLIYLLLDYIHFWAVGYCVHYHSVAVCRMLEMF